MRLIDADAAIEFVKGILTVHRYYHPRSTTENIPISEVIDKIAQVPTIDAVPVVHGHWEYIGGYGYQYRCPNCIKCAEHKTAFCPHCGAKMDEVTE